MYCTLEIVFEDFVDLWLELIFLGPSDAAYVINIL
jgi:hypothetical protein